MTQTRPRTMAVAEKARPGVALLFGMEDMIYSGASESTPSLELRKCFRCFVRSTPTPSPAVFPKSAQVIEGRGVGFDSNAQERKERAML